MLSTLAIYIFQNKRVIYQRTCQIRIIYAYAIRECCSWLDEPWPLRAAIKVWARARASSCLTFFKSSTELQGLPGFSPGPVSVTSGFGSCSLAGPLFWDDFFLGFAFTFCVLPVYKGNWRNVFIQLGNLNYNKKKILKIPTNLHFRMVYIK